MIITDHINMLPNPLIGPNLEEFGPRFPDMTRPYDPALVELAVKVAGRMGIPVRKGVYLGCTGPTYETPHEYKFGIRDAIRDHSGVCFLNHIASSGDDQRYVTDGFEIVKQADIAATKMSALFEGIIKEL